MKRSNYFSAVNGRTGSLLGQPGAAATRSEWYFDEALNYQVTGFLDAPEIMPSGGIMTMAGSFCTLELANVDREA